MKKIANNMGNAITKIVEQMKERNQSGNVNIQRMIGAASTLGVGANALHGVYENRDPAQTEAAHKLKVKKTSTQYKTKVEKSKQAIYTSHKDEMISIGERIHKELNLVPNELAGEMRAALVRQNAKDRRKTINELIDSKNGPLLAAVTAVPAILSGIDELEKANYLKLFTEQNAAPLIKERDRLSAVYEDVSAVISAADRASTAYIDNDELESIEAQQQRALAAQESFDTTD